MIDRSSAWRILAEFTRSDRLRKHALAVEASAILAHADYSGCPRISILDRAIYACDELSGFVTACALVRPGKTIAGLEVALTGLGGRLYNPLTLTWGSFVSERFPVWRQSLARSE